MKEISRAKRLEVAHHYLLGCTYAEIEAETGISHGSIANIVEELDNGKLTMPGTPPDQVNDLRQLSLDLKKTSLKPSQAVLGLLLYKRLQTHKRLQTLGISADLLDGWSELVKILLPTGFPAKDFLEVALRLHELEKEQGKSFETLAEDYARLKESVDKLNSKVESLSETKEKLTKDVESLHSQLVPLESTKTKIDTDIQIQTTRLKEIKLRLSEVKEERAQLDREIKGLHRRKTKLSSEIDGREESLGRLNDIGFSDEDLLRLTAFIEATSKNEGITSNKLRERFFLMLSLYGDVAGLEDKREAETKQVGELVKRQSVLRGEIIELGKEKGLLEGEISSTITSTSQTLKAIGEDATSQIQQHVTDVTNQLNGLLVDAMKAGEAIAGMRHIMNNAGASEKALTNFIVEVQNRVRGN